MRIVQNTGAPSPAFSIRRLFAATGTPVRARADSAKGQFNAEKKRPPRRNQKGDDLGPSNKTPHRLTTSTASFGFQVLFSASSFSLR